MNKNTLFYIINGASGRMGKEITALLKEDSYFQFETAIVGQKLDRAVVIDFSSPKGFEQSLSWSVKNKIPFVSGTTGLSAKQFSLLKQAGKKIPVLWSPNMSIGINLLITAITAMGAKLANFELMIQEFHHIHKKDAPSGTAKILKDTIETSMKKGSSKKKKEIIIQSFRAGSIIGVHKIFMISDTETLTFEHTVQSRAVFAQGAIEASNWLAHEKNNLYTMEDFLSEK
jgi:4-hydroxy-tetrahydrodipicolinate reductase